MVIVGWALIWAAPDSHNANGSGEICTDARDFGDGFFFVVFGSAVIGGLAWGTASLRAESGLGRLLGYATVTICAPYVIFVPWVLFSFCGWN